MSVLPRRLFLAGLGLGVALPLRAAPVGVGVQIDAIRRVWRREREHGARPLGDHPDAAPLAGALTAMAAARAVHRLGPADQAHPAAQALLGELCRAIGDASQRCHALMASWLADPAPQAERSLRLGLGDLRQGLSDWHEGRVPQHALGEGLDGLTGDERPGILRVKCRRILRRQERTAALAADIAASWEQTGVLDSADPVLRRSVQEGQLRWGQAAPVEVDERLVLGLLAIGAVVVLGVVLVAGAACAGASVFPGLVGLVLVGVALVGLMVRWMVRPEPLPTDADTVLQGAMLVLPPDGHWHDAGVELGFMQGASVLATGRLRHPMGWRASPDGGAWAVGEEAPMPGATRGTLLGRVGDTVFVLGRRGEVPQGLEGPLELCINIDPDSRLIEGEYRVQVVVELAL